MDDLLKEEAARIKTGKFFQFTQTTGPAAMAELEMPFGPLPPDYKNFVLTFGKGELFRDEERGSHALQVFGSPEIERTDAGKSLLKFGVYSSAPYTWADAFFRKDETGMAFLPEVFEGSRWQLRRVADNFDAWFADRFRRIRKRYSKAQWQWVLDGPRPFDAREQAIVDAIPFFKWRIVRLLPDARVEVEVFNGSELMLPALTIGWRATWAHSRTALPIAGLHPGETMIVTKDFTCYGKSLSPEKLEFFQMPLPEPEDRCLYWEFGDANLQCLKPQMPARRVRSSPAKNPYRRYGPGKELWDITLDDLRAHPIWLYAEFLVLDEDEIELKGSEAWMRPALRQTNVTPEMYRPLILLENEKLGLSFSAICNLPESKSESISVLRGNCAASLTDLVGVSPPLVLTSISQIDRVKNVLFVCNDFDSSEALRENA